MSTECANQLPSLMAKLPGTVTATTLSVNLPVSWATTITGHAANVNKYTSQATTGRSELVI
ncbi:unnamed protein product [Protopolystoma xenopodis]|uniref:Uncharacterized protein n=1 Tax=Protopolystoma xenopodis TaxID=117903 RepID=A0A448X1U6_9PLAT|nr:unnamed protein product [Protopolystoma xenopodis]